MYSFVFRFACSLIAQVLGVVGSFPTSCLSIWMSWVVLQQQETLSPCCLSLFQLPGECCAIQVSAQMNALLWLYTLEAYKAKAALLHSERIRPPFGSAVPLQSRTPRTARSLPPGVSQGLLCLQVTLTTQVLTVSAFILRHSQLLLSLRLQNSFSLLGTEKDTGSVWWTVVDFFPFVPLSDYCKGRNWRDK